MNSLKPSSQFWKRPGTLISLIVLIALSQFTGTMLYRASSLKLFGSESNIDSYYAASLLTMMTYHPSLLLHPNHSQSPGLMGRFQASYRAQAVNKWESLFKKYPIPAVLRREAVTLALLHAQGSQWVVEQIPKFSNSLGNELARGTAAQAQESVFWGALYGKNPVPKQELPALKETLKRLDLGWFENIALAQLYMKAGMRSPAVQAADSAERTAELARSYLALQLTFTIFGSLILFILILMLIVVPIMKLDLARIGRVSIQPSLPPAPLLAVFLLYLSGMVGMFWVSAAIRSQITAYFHRHFAGYQLSLFLFLNLAMYTVIIVGIGLLLKRIFKSRDMETGSSSLRTIFIPPEYKPGSIPLELALGFVVYLGLYPALKLTEAISGHFFSRFHTPVNPIVFTTLGVRSLPLAIGTLLLVGVLAPIVEETMFRGVLYPALRNRMGITGAILLSSAVFASLHPDLPNGFLPIFIMGVFLASLREWRQSLIPGIALHSLINTILTFGLFLPSWR